MRNPARVTICETRIWVPSGCARPKFWSHTNFSPVATPTPTFRSRHQSSVPTSSLPTSTLLTMPCHAPVARWSAAPPQSPSKTSSSWPPPPELPLPPLHHHLPCLHCRSRVVSRSSTPVNRPLRLGPDHQPFLASFPHRRLRPLRPAPTAASLDPSQPFPPPPPTPPPPLRSRT